MAKIKGVSVGADGTAWCVDTDNRLWKLEESGWKKNPSGRAVEVAVGDNDNVWCRNAAGEVFKLDGDDWNDGWVKDTKAKDVQTISAAADGTVWVGNKRGELFKRVGKNSWSLKNPTGSAVEVTVGSAKNVWCRNAAGNVFQLQGSDWDSAWKKDTMASWAQSISAAADGTVWLTAKAPQKVDRMWKREGANSWKENPKGYARQVSVGNDHRVMCVNKDGECYRLLSPDWDSDWEKMDSPT